MEKWQALMRNTGDDGGHVRTLLGAFLLGGLSAPEESAVRAHLSHCAECRDERDYLACVPQWLDLIREPVDGEESKQPKGDADPGIARPALHVVESPDD